MEDADSPLEGTAQDNIAARFGRLKVRFNYTVVLNLNPKSRTLEKLNKGGAVLMPVFLI